MIIQRTLRYRGAFEDHVSKGWRKVVDGKGWGDEEGVSLKEEERVVGETITCFFLLD
jgi:hypothetical protein